MAERGIVRVKDSEKVVLLEDGDVPEAEFIRMEFSKYLIDGL